MKLENRVMRLSATDLSSHLACDHLTTLGYSTAHGTIQRPSWTNPDSYVLQQLGLEHETRYINHLAALGLQIIDLRHSNSHAAAETLAAMKNGTSVIVQATLSNARWVGRADLLRRVDTPSSLGSWSYEVYDCKLARETKAATILQLSLYSELLGMFQETAPNFMYVVSPSETFVPEQFSVLEYAAYYRLIKKKLEAAVDAGRSEWQTYPEPSPQCEICRWWQRCDAQWRNDDHLSLVAGMSRLQRKQVTTWGCGTVSELATLPIPLQQRPEYGAKEGYVRVREQARVQVAGRNQNQPVHEVFDNQGLARLPEPSPGDIFFDLEGCSFVGPSGMEYLFGLTRFEQHGSSSYECRWCHTPAEEKQAFEWFVDLVMASWSEHFDMHVYHFTAREPSALKRLMGKYGTREDEVDRILRGELLVDVHRALKLSVRASVEEYSLKNLEVFHNFVRKIPVGQARSALRVMEHALELGSVGRVAEPTRETIRSYNEEDCLSTASLRNWLEQH